MLGADLTAISRKGNVCFEEVCMLLEELCQIRTANLLLTLQQKLQGHASL